MLRLLVALQLVHFLFGFVSKSLIVTGRGKRVFLRQSRSSLHMGMGSDVLIRPDDEDGPEFKDYLRQLLRMQANRAGGGFAAPSSGSADAYMAKLNRLKIEQNRRRQLGLSVEDIDTSYRPEDYLQARIEGADPLVSDTVLKGADAIAGAQQGRKLRPLSPDELKAAEIAEMRVQAALAKKGGTVVQTEVSPILPSSVQPESVSQPRDELDEHISRLLNPAKPVETINIPKVSSSIVNERKPVMAVATTSVRQSVETSAPKAQPVLNERKPVEAVAIPRVTSVATNERKFVESVSVPRVSPVALSNNRQDSYRKLTRDELELVASTLKLLVQHRLGYFCVLVLQSEDKFYLYIITFHCFRGGGPFGNGRLKGAEAQSLVSSLTSVFNMLQRDAIVAPKSSSVPVPTVKSNPLTEAPAQVQTLFVDKEDITSTKEEINLGNQVSLSAKSLIPSSAYQVIDSFDNDIQIIKSSTVEV
jgi:hypothetical protein